MKALKEIYQEQKDFQTIFYDIEKLSNETKVFWSKEFILAIHRELGEVLENLPWKLHMKNDYENIEYDELGIELIDCFKYLLNLFILWGIEPDEIVALFFKKSKRVREKYANEQQKK